MPFDPETKGSLDLYPLRHLHSGGTWQVELAHERDSHLILWITRGQGRVFLNGHCRGFGPHTAIFIPAKSLFFIEIGRQSQGQVLQIDEATSCNLPQEALQVRIGDMQEQGRINALFDAMLREQSLADAHALDAKRNYAELIGITLNRLCVSAGPVQKRSAAHKLCLSYCRELVQDAGCMMNMAAHAENLGVTPTHLTRVCKQETGKTAATLLIERQLHAARNLLIGSSVSMRDIAEGLGFGSAAYFTRFITHHTGQTPSALRRIARKNEDARGVSA